jgi:hypothetical protein
LLLDRDRMDDFEITTCHSNRAGDASVSLRDRRTGAIVSIHAIPFRHDYGETPDAQCARIQAEALAICERAASALAGAAAGQAAAHPSPEHASSSPRP